MMKRMEEDMDDQMNSMGFLKVAHEGSVNAKSSMSSEETLSSGGMTLKIGVSGTSQSKNMEENVKQLNKVSIELFNLITAEESEEHQQKMQKLLGLIQNLDDYVGDETVQKAEKLCN